MEFLDVISRRRAVRQYLPTPIEKPLIERLVRAAVQAPSAMNQQPWAYAVITGVDRIDQYAHRARAPLMTSSVVPPQLRDMLSNPEFSMFYHAPLLVLVLAKTDQPQAREDSCLAAQTLMLAARNEGLGSCWIGLAVPWLNLAEIKKELGLPPDCHVLAPIVMGHPAAWPESPGRLEPEIHWLR